MGNDNIKRDERTTGANKNYMSIAVSVLIAEFTTRHNGGAARQESSPKSELHIVPNVSTKPNRLYDN